MIAGDKKCSWLMWRRDVLTLRVQEVVDQHVVTTLRLDGCVLVARGRAVAHVLLAQRLNMSIDVGGSL